MSDLTKTTIPVGRPRLQVDYALILRMREVQHMGWSRIAEAHRELTGEYISRDTVKRRYLDAKRLISGDH